jgi:mRNA-degrading endonuclease RelE of RelBE toxin-antitoxin system
MQVLLHPKAGKSLARLARAAKSRILYRLENLSKDHPEGDMLKDLCGFGLRVGGYRILYEKRDGAVFVTNILTRGQAYKE